MAQDTTTIVTADVDFGPTMKWGAIFGGWLVATAFAGLLYAFGLAVGFSAFDPHDPDMNAKVIGIGTAVWMILTWAVSLFLGGMFASWFDGRDDETIGTLHGVTVWGLSAIATALIAALGVGHLIKGGTAVVGGAVKTAAFAGAAAAPQLDSGSILGSGAVTQLQAQLTQRMNERAQTAVGSQTAAGSQTPTGSQATGSQIARAPSSSRFGSGDSASQSPAQSSASSRQLDPQGLAAVSRALISGKADDARALLTIHTGMPPSEIDQMLQTMSADVEKFKVQAKQAADTASRAAATAMWIVFFQALIGLLAAAVGGWLGSGHVRHVHHTRRYS